VSIWIELTPRELGIVRAEFSRAENRERSDAKTFGWIRIDTGVMERARLKRASQIRKIIDKLEGAG